MVTEGPGGDETMVYDITLSEIQAVPMEHWSFIGGFPWSMILHWRISKEHDPTLEDI